MTCDRITSVNGVAYNGSVPEGTRYSSPIDLSKYGIPQTHILNLSATGEGAVVYSAARAHILLGPVGILTPNGLLGEVTPAMAAAVGGSDAVKILLPSQRCSIRLAVSGPQTLQACLEEAARQLREETGRLLGT